MEIGDLVQISDFRYICPAIHTVETFRKALSSQAEEALNWFNNPSRRRPSDDEINGVMGTIIAIASRFNSGRESDNVFCVRISTTPPCYVNITQLGVSLIGQAQKTIDPYEGYTKTPDGFWTKQSNWDKWLL